MVFCLGLLPLFSVHTGDGCVWSRTPNAYAHHTSLRRTHLGLSRKTLCLGKGVDLRRIDVPADGVLDKQRERWREKLRQKVVVIVGQAV